MQDDLLKRVETLESEIKAINEALVKLDFFNFNKENNTLLFSQVDYEKLPELEKNNGKIYLIKD